MFFNVTKVRQLWSQITVILYGGHQTMNVTEMTISLQNWQIVTDLSICQFCNIIELLNMFKILMCIWLKSSSWVCVIQTCYPVSQKRVSLKSIKLLDPTCFWVCIKQGMLQNWQIVTDLSICQFCNIIELLNLFKILMCSWLKSSSWVCVIQTCYPVSQKRVSLKPINLLHVCGVHQTRNVTELTNRYRFEHLSIL